MNKVTKVVGKQQALKLASTCITHSILFEVEPLPDGLCAFFVRKGDERILFDKYAVICRSKQTRIESGIVHAESLARAINQVRNGAWRGCYVGSHDANIVLAADEVEHVDQVGEEGESGFIIRPEVVDGAVVSYVCEEWVNGDIVDSTNGVYSWARRWISDNHAGHWSRRYSLNELCDLWNEVLVLPLDKFGVHLTVPFMFFPAGASIYDVQNLIMDANPLFADIAYDCLIGDDHWLRKQAIEAVA